MSREKFIYTFGLTNITRFRGGKRGDGRVIMNGQKALWCMMPQLISTSNKGRRQHQRREVFQPFLSCI